MINTIMKKFEDDLLELFNTPTLPFEFKYQVYKNIFMQLENLRPQILQMEEEQEKQNNETKTED